MIDYVDEDVVAARNLEDISYNNITIRLNFFLIISCVEGCIQLDMNNKTYLLNKDDIIICLPTAILSQTKFSSGHKLRIMGFSTNFLHRVVKREEISNNILSHIHKNPLRHKGRKGADLLMAEKEIKGIKKFLEEFKAFAMRGNVLDMAVGVVVGSAFTAIVTSIVQNLLTPLLGLLIPDSTFAEWAPGGFGIGAVINSIISFIITAFVVFLLVKGVNKLTHLKKQEEQAQEPEEPAGPTTEELLTEIRDLLKEQK